MNVQGQAGGAHSAIACRRRSVSPVLSLAGSPFLPWEDPTTAVVFGGIVDVGNRRVVGE